MNRPPPGTMVWWRFRQESSCPFKFGYCTYLDSPTLVRMGYYNGDNYKGPVVDVNEIEWRKYA